MATTPELDKLLAHIAAQPTETLIAALLSLGDPPSGSAERLVVMHTCDQLEKRHDLTDDILAFCDDDYDGTYSDLILLALIKKGIQP